MIFTLMHLMLDCLWHLPALVDWMVLEESCFWIPVIFSMAPCFFLLVTMVMIMLSNYGYWNIDMLSCVSHWFIVDVCCCVLNRLVINMSHSMLNWLELSMGCVVCMTLLWMVVMRTFVMIVSDMGIKRSHHSLMVLGCVLMVVSMIMEFNMWLDSFTSMDILFMVMVLDWVSNFMVNDFMMMVWSCMVNIIMDLMDMGWLMMM